MKKLNPLSSSSLFVAGQIVRGMVAGTFEILGFRHVEGQEFAQLVAVNPSNHSERARGTLVLPVENLRTLSF